MDYGSKVPSPTKKKYVWKQSVDINDTAIKMLSRQEDRNIGLDIVNFMTYHFPDSVHLIDAPESRSFYALEFRKIYKITHEVIIDLITEFPQIKDAMFKISDDTGTVEIVITVEVYYNDDYYKFPQPGVFRRFENIDSPLKKDYFTKVMAEDGESWRGAWEGVYQMTRDIIESVYNMEEFPPGIEMQLGKEASKNNTEVRVKFKNFGTVSYSFLEYMSDMIAKKYSFRFHFSCVEDGGGHLSVSLMYSDQPENEYPGFVRVVPKRSLLESSAKRPVFAANEKKRSREDDDLDGVTVVNIGENEGTRKRGKDGIGNVILRWFKK